MGAQQSTIDSLMGGFVDIGDVGSSFGNYGNCMQNFSPVNPEGILLKISDSTTRTVYDLTVTKSRNGNVKLEEYLIETEKGVYEKCHDFVIVGDELRKALRDLNVLDSDMRFESKPRLSVPYCLDKFSILEFKAKKKAVIAELVSLIKESCPIFAKMDESIAEGNIPLAAMGYYLKIGTKVVLQSKDFSQGAYIQSVSGSTVNCTTLSQNRHGKFIECKVSVKLTEQSYTTDELHKHICPISEEDQVYKELAARGAAIVASKGTVRYMSYTGPIFEKPEVVRCYEHNIRVMMDLYNNIPDSYNESLAKIGSREKELDFVPDSQLFSVLGSIPVYHIEKSEYISVVFDKLQPIQFNENYYDELVLDHKYKEFLSLVTSSNQARSTQIDSIKGKGNGLLFILSGPPGVGKTMSVEALAEKNHVPLMIISFGNLGTTPDNVERALKDIMRLAEYWNAILLFDEADVFLESRNNSSDVARNAIVGVFLQALEYHKGVIFLTTNRETSLDPAIISRAVLTIKYQPSTIEQALIIWYNMLARVTTNVDDIILKLQHLTDIVRNGRDIRNVIHIALILAQGKDLTFEHIQQAMILHSN